MISTSNKYKNGKGEQYPVIGNFIHYHIIQNKIKKADVARALGILPTGLNEYFKKESLQFAILWKLSTAMNYNFIAHLGEYLPYRYETLREKALKQELAEKNALIQKMEIQLETMRELLNK
ncbi:transcriptional regulator [Flavobacterium sp. N3904]|uniref:transcriptional regulator n=1 Tax=Flavobacterium sp. N3904 TaxID=2986835 RepID=UPI0022255CDE|nr:transcriptional regulator [Flavobacterium sp. N3904]